MSARDRRKRNANRPAAAGATAPGAPAAPQHQPTPMPVWHWRTFPVYFMFSLGGFIGLYMGIIASGGGVVSIVAFTFWAILLGFGLSRFTSRWMISRGWHRTQRKR